MNEMNTIIVDKVLANDGGILVQIKELEGDRDRQRDQVEKLKEELSVANLKSDEYDMFMKSSTASLPGEEIEGIDDNSLNLKDADMTSDEGPSPSDRCERDKKQQENPKEGRKSSEGESV